MKTNLATSSRQPLKNSPASNLVLGLLLLAFSAISASAIGLDSLWLSNNNSSFLPVLNTDRNGNILRSLNPPNPVTGIAINPNNNTIYMGGTSGGAAIIRRDLGTLAINGTPFTPAALFQGDMAFDGNFLWRINTQHSLEKIDPSTGTLLATVPFTLAGAATYGLAWDGSNFWISQIGPGGLVLQITPAGVFTGQSFNVSSSFQPGGLAFDTTDNTLFIGTNNAVYHYTLTGTQLGSFAVPGQGYIDGLEFQSTDAVPEQSTVVLILVGTFSLAASKYLRRPAAV